MSFDDDLVLGLGLRTSQNTMTPTKPENKEPCLNIMELPTYSLTLGLSSDVKKEDFPVTKIDVNRACENHKPAASESIFTRQASSHSVVSSFSNASKRERDAGTEDIEVERLSSRASDEDEENTNSTRKKLRLTKEQSGLLEESFKQHSTLNPKQKQGLARQLSLRPRQVEVWFQNRRARTKLKQTEVDCEFLKKCCETLTDENRRLQKELQELKALKLAQPFYMHMPAATLTMCPSCERINGMAVKNSTKKSQFSMAPKPHLYNPFTNPSAAC